jgi:hypothetical protein
VHVPFHPHDQSIEFTAVCEAGDLHGNVGHWHEAPPDASRRIGFRLPPRLVNGFPRSPCISIDGVTWEACDLRDAPP